MFTEYIVHKGLIQILLENILRGLLHLNADGSNHAARSPSLVPILYHMQYNTLRRPLPG